MCVSVCVCVCVRAYVYDCAFYTHVCMCMYGNQTCCCPSRVSTSPSPPQAVTFIARMVKAKHYNVNTRVRLYMCVRKCVCVSATPTCPTLLLTGSPAPPSPSSP